MRGQHLFKSLFPVFEDTSDNAGDRKGRNAELHAKRNELLLQRYYYYGKYTDIRYPSIIKNLSSEFFLSERRVQDVILNNTETLKAIRSSAPDIPELRKTWPHLKW